MDNIINLGIPHIGEQIFGSLGDADLIQYLKVSQTWKVFVFVVFRTSVNLSPDFLNSPLTDYIFDFPVDFAFDSSSLYAQPSRLLSHCLALIVLRHRNKIHHFVNNFPDSTQSFNSSFVFSRKPWRPERLHWRSISKTTNRKY